MRVEPQAIPLLCGLAALVVTDLHARRLPNWIVLPLWACGIGLHAWAGGAGSAVGSAIESVAAAAPLGLAFSAGLCGGGDVKLLGAIAAWLGCLTALWVLAAGLLLSGLYAAVQLASNASLRREVQTHLLVLASGAGMPAPRRSRRQMVPFGAALAVSAALAALWLGISHA
ncbi:MAG TPA: A24 family peptidase [Polyangia bacterium]|nr:A24 family peptidase [Polyangia bacterium]